MFWGLLLTATCVLAVVACGLWQIRRVDGIVREVDRRLERQDRETSGDEAPSP